MSAPLSIQPQGDQLIVTGDTSIRELPANQFEISITEFDEATAESTVKDTITVTIQNLKTPKQYEDFLPKILGLVNIAQQEGVDVGVIWELRKELVQILLEYTDLTQETVDGFSVVELRNAINSFIESKLVKAISSLYLGTDEKKA